MPRHSRTASVTIAALVVAVAATVASLGAPVDVDAATDRPADGSPRTAVSATSAADAPSDVPDAASRGRSGDGTAEAPEEGRPAGDPADRADRAVLFVGRSPEINPRGGTAKSFACRAAVALGWTCHVREGAASAVPASIQADVVVVALVPGDDATRVARLLDTLPAGAAGARLVLLGPVAPAGGPVGAVAARADERRWAGLRRLAAARGAVVVDPVAEGWVTAATRRTYLSADGDHLTGAGHVHVGRRLSVALEESIGS